MNYPSPPLNLPYRLVLGSASPRRQELLQKTGLDFVTRLIPVDESLDPQWENEKVPEHLARLKSSVIPLADDELLLTADTLVFHRGQIMGKPRDEADAIDMLTQLSGNQHDVITGVCLRTNQKEIVWQTRTRLEWLELNPYEIRWYVQTYQPWDKAGAYGIQDWMGLRAIKSIEGCPLNVMGLPLPLVYEKLASEFSR